MKIKSKTPQGFVTSFKLTKIACMCFEIKSLERGCYSANSSPPPFLQLLFCYFLTSFKNDQRKSESLVDTNLFKFNKTKTEKITSFELNVSIISTA